ncbi:uncharacterized protein TNCV_2376541 [Trichonephila clavipes]|nr:uncharacterized protein TNCV_2376541 [Trichonephila clavipes]
MCLRNCLEVGLRYQRDVALKQWRSVGEGLNIHQCAQKTRALHTVLEAKREEFVDDALIHAKSLCEELEISLEPPRRIRRKHIFGDKSKDAQVSYDDDLRRTMFSSIDRVTDEIRERFQQLQNLEQKICFFKRGDKFPVGSRRRKPTLRHCFEILSHLPYSPDLAPKDVFLFPNLRLRGYSHGSLLVKVTTRGWRITSSIPIPLKTRRVGSDARETCQELKRPPVDVVWLLAQVSSSSLYQGSKLRGPSPKALE